MMQISKSMLDVWWQERRNDPSRIMYLRIGQDFFNHFCLHKCTGKDRDLMDRLYNLDGIEALRIIETLTDYGN